MASTDTRHISPDSFLIGAVIALTSGLVVMSGCSDDDPPAPAATAELTLDDYCEVYFEALCERQIGCNVAIINQATSVQECLNQATARCKPEVESWKPSISASRVLFSAELLAECRETLPATSCKELAAGKRPDACVDTLKGTIKDNDPCYAAVECEGGGACSTFGRCPSVCEPSPTGRNPYDCNLIGCDEGSYCNGSVCDPKLPQGAACIEEDACQEGLFCGKDLNAPDLQCRPLKLEGEACFSRSNCGEGLSCQPLGGGEGSVCLPAIAAGEPCTDSDQCAAGIICDRITGLCDQLRQEEEECFGPFDCAQGLYCWDDPLFDTGSCREQYKVGLAEGEPCNPVLDRCRLGQYCRRQILGEEAGICTLLPELGEPCADFPRNLNQQCRVGECVLFDGALTCIELVEDGTPCTSRTECVSNACVDGACQPYNEVACVFNGETQTSQE